MLKLAVKMKETYDNPINDKIYEKDKVLIVQDLEDKTVDSYAYYYEDECMVDWIPKDKCTVLDTLEE